MLISVIITTYNWPEALKKSLKSLDYQTDRNFEILIADDGSDDRTKMLVESFSTKTDLAIRHIWHEDKGFRAASIRNKAAARANGEYLIFIDGDCAVPPSFIKKHCELAESGFFVPGNRVLLSEQATPVFLATRELFFKRSLWQWLKSWWRGECNRFFPFVTLRLGWLRKINPKKWCGAKTCNLGLFRQDFISVNGMDENYIGWGFEDSDLVIRLQKFGIKRKAGRNAVPVIHLWHKINSDAPTTQQNRERLESMMRSKTVRCSLGVDQYL